ncbi:calcium/sodium antiporter [Haloprofundus sp. MHR1]|uniref:calcium/sodium antiporter n=1 Tax=Haloprofundus sp. MHR1 TaxID=2572921 RepID=UPI0010BEC7D8|nr:calcium/sodium antiporter [Haloprofundus sp. MHR1]
MPSIAVDVAVIAVSIAVLWIGARMFVDSAVHAARRFGLSELTIGLTVVAVGTSSPEIAVSLEAALESSPDIAVGNVIGSNIFNVAVILGIVALVRWVPISRGLVRRDGLAVLASAALALAVLFDGVVTRLEGLVLLALFGGYLFALFRLTPDGPGVDGSEAAGATAGSDFGAREALELVGGLALVVVAGQFLIDSATALARVVGVSEWVIGATVVAAGTSTPEFAVSVVALTRGSSGVSVGNVLGSNIFNVLFVLGLAATVAPLSVGPAAFDGALWSFGLSTLLVAALWSGHRLSRLEGGLFVGSEVVRWLRSIL